VIEETDHVGGKVGKRHGTVGVGGVAMALEVDGDHLKRLGQPGDHRPEARLGVQHAAVQHDEGSACPVDLVIEVDAVDRYARSAHRSLLPSAVVV
jgi:hypothetical protein